jgi:hypothetical protein
MLTEQQGAKNQYFIGNQPISKTGQGAADSDRPGHTE